MSKKDVVDILVSNLDIEDSQIQELRFNEEDNEISLLFNRENKTDYIVFGLHPNDRRTPNLLTIGNVIHSWVCFQDVTSVLNYIYTKTEQSKTTEREFEIIVSQFPDWDKKSNLIFDISNAAISNNNVIYKDTLLKKAKELQDYLMDYHLPFLRRVSTIQVVNDEIIDKVPHMELSDYIPGQYMTFKKQIIMKLCHNPRYQEYVDWLDGNYLSAMQINPEKYSGQYKMFQDLTEFLDSGKHKELI